MPIDGYLRLLTERGELKTAVVAPFLTTIDIERGAISHTQTLLTAEHRLFLLLRNAFYVERDLTGVVLPGIDAYIASGKYRGLDLIRKRVALSAGPRP